MVKRAKNDFNPFLNRNPDDFYTPKQHAIRRLALAVKRPFVAAKPTITIVDASHWNTINWDELKKNGVVGIILKCSEGAEGTYYEFKDPTFETNWKTALDKGFTVMTYHFFRGYRGSDEKSWYMKCADNFLNDERINGDTAAWLDCEVKQNGVSTSTYTRRAFGFCSLIEGEGIRDGIYSSPGLVPQLFDPAYTNWGSVSGWVAHWTSLSEPALPTGWSWDMLVGWQNGISGTHSWIPVVNGDDKIDHNLFYFTDEQALRDWLGQESAPPPVDCCEEHALLIATLQAGQQVLTDVQNDLLARMGAVEANFASLADEVGNLKEADAQIRLDIGLMQTEIDTLQKKVREAGEALLGDE
jgi:GH25 family lysozyme M1 (1,4-beta-N-acetylmuramidase)